MQFDFGGFSAKIISVLELGWEKNNTYVSPREFNAISFRIKGDAVFSDGKTDTYVSDNDILFMPANVGYHLKSNKEKLVVIHFDLENNTENCFKIIHPDNADRFKELFLAALDSWNNKKAGYYLKTVSIFYSILEKLVKEQARSLKNPTYDKLKPAIRYINQNFSDPQLDVAFLCTLVNISGTYFRKLFFELYNTTPNKYISDLRISYAKELLTSGYCTVESAAEKSGFSDVKYFSRVFKKQCGVSPSAYSK